jgi:uncharacterized membrane protein YadS
VAIGRLDPRGDDGSPWRALAIPPFILAFLGLVVLNSLVAVPVVIGGNALIASKVLLLAVTATAMRTRTDLIRNWAGPRCCRCWRPRPRPLSWPLALPAG